ncbi:hypothetical protein RDWZM_005726 [Blomia tropicalis]|uniref:Tumor suppressor candidate 3 n=1 Tax=Blomia tropicalis TaxID=40697 RepID=A0A9Q0M6S3_BLOTA|nr:hypothetical protein RDWZM_005726 [Blomia tropicalis]
MQPTIGHQPLEERVQSLIDLSFKKPMIRLNPEKFRTFIGSKSVGQPVRNYTMIVMMTALSPMRQCSVCRSAADEFSIVANSWRYSPQFQPNLFFGYVDYDEGGEIFQQLGINSAPVFFHFGERSVRATGFSVKSADQMDIQRIGFAAETIARWVFEKTSTTIRVVRPPNYAASFFLLVLFTLISILLYVKRNNLDFLYNKTSWALIALAIVFAMTSGQMWSHIRSPPLMQRSQKGGISYIHGSSSGQFIIETYIIFALNAAITIGFILLVESMKQGGNKIADQKKKIMAIAGLVLVAVFFSLLLSIFRGKAHGYPYSFLFK